jgi:GNAT superfamily N-acetyltransferase
MKNYPEHEDYVISTDNSLLDLPMIHEWLSNESYWAKDIPFQTVMKALNHSLCFGLYFHKQQVGFARVVTDRATFAYLADVFILDAHRGKGLSKWMMETIHAHPELQGLRRWMLVTRDAHGLYENCGWERLNDEQAGRTMLRHFPNVYRSTGNK